MPVARRLRARAFALVAGLTVALSFSVVPQSSAVTVPKPLNDTRAAGTAPVEVDFPIEYFGLVADLPSKRAHLEDRGRAPFGQARFRVDGRWTAWQTLGQDGAQALGQFTGALVSVDRADAYQVRGLPPGARSWRAAAINTTDGPAVVVDRRRADAATASPGCMSRADWGADESISGWNTDGDQQAFSPAQVMTVHHTAGPNNADQDYAATVRAIYSYHVKTNGWSDIGYQYLVDSSGVLYEGRNTGHTSTSCLNDGGDGSDFAHEPITGHVVTGAHTQGYNTGNVGIALMGCFDPAPTACTGATRPTYAAQAALETQLADLATRHGLDPEGTTRYVNPDNQKTKDTDTISGHRDHGATQCPGDHLYELLPMIRSNVASRMAGPDPENPAVVAFATALRTVQENAGTVRLAVTRTGNTTVPASVDYARTAGTGTPDRDFAFTPGTLTFAAGETRKTIRITVNDDSARERRETIVVDVSNQAPGTVLRTPTSMTLRIAPSDQRPDGWISTTASSGYVGDNIYNTTARKQTKKLTARRTQTRTFYVRVYNDGNVTNTIAINGTAARRGSRVHYFTGTNDISTTVKSAKGWRVRLKPGAFKLIKVRIRVLRTAAHGSRKPARVTATWTGDGTRTDTVKAVVKVIR
jgi:hypothetical protein